ERDTALHQSSCQQAALTERAPAVAIAQGRAFLRQIKCPRGQTTLQPAGTVVSVHMACRAGTGTTGQKFGFHLAKKAKSLAGTSRRGRLNILHLQCAAARGNNKRRVPWPKEPGGDRPQCESALRHYTHKTWQISLSVGQLVRDKAAQTWEANRAL